VLCDCCAQIAPAPNDATHANRINNRRINSSKIESQRRGSAAETRRTQRPGRLGSPASRANDARPAAFGRKPLKCRAALARAPSATRAAGTAARRPGVRTRAVSASLRLCVSAATTTGLRN